MAALADAGLIDLNTKLRVPGSIEVQRRTIKDHWDHGPLNLTIAGVVAKSSNVGTIMAAQQMRIPQFVKYLHDFGFGEPTGLNFPGESKGLMKPGDEWPELTRSNVAFGQGLSVNAVQMTAAVNAVANGGVYVPPKLVRNYIDANGTVIPNQTRGAAPGGEREGRQGGRHDDGGGDREEGHRAAGGDRRLPGGRQDRYGAAGRPEDRQVRQVGDFFRRIRSCRQPTVRYVRRTARSPGARGGGFQGGPVFRDVMSYALQKYVVPPSGAKQPDVPVTW